MCVMTSENKTLPRLLQAYRLSSLLQCFLHLDRSGSIGQPVCNCQDKSP